MNFVHVRRTGDPCHVNDPLADRGYDFETGATRLVTEQCARELLVTDGWELIVATDFQILPADPATTASKE